MKVMDQYPATRYPAGQAALVAACLLALVGCSQGDPLTSGSLDRQTRIVLNLCSNFYDEFLRSHGGAPPKDQEAFRAYMESRREDLARYNVKELDQLLVSPRDGKPFLFVVGKRVAPPNSPGTPWAAYEQVGVEGKIMAVQVRGGVHELTADELAKIVGQE